MRVAGQSQVRVDGCENALDPDIIGQSDINSCIKQIKRAAAWSLNDHVAEIVDIVSVVPCAADQ